MKAIAILALLMLGTSAASAQTWQIETIELTPGMTDHIAILEKPDARLQMRCLPNDGQASISLLVRFARPYTWDQRVSVAWAINNGQSTTVPDVQIRYHYAVGPWSHETALDILRARRLQIEASGQPAITFEIPADTKIMTHDLCRRNGADKLRGMLTPQQQ